MDNNKLGAMSQNISVREYLNTFLLDGTFTRIAKNSTNSAAPTTAKGECQILTAEKSRITPKTLFQVINLR